MSYQRLMMTAQERVVAGLTNEGIQVVFDAEVPCADLENRVMHLRPIPDFVDDVALEDIRGDCDHEMGHFLYTEVETLKAAKDPLEQVLFNAIEDGRIERLVSDRWFGCAENLHNSGVRAVREILLKADQSREWQERRLMIALQFLAYGHTEEYALWMSGADVKELLDEIREDIDGIDRMKSSWDALNIAIKIAARMRKKAKGGRKALAPGSKSNRGRKGQTEQEKTKAAFSKFAKPPKEPEGGKEEPNESVLDSKAGGGPASEEESEKKKGGGKKGSSEEKGEKKGESAGEGSDGVAGEDQTASPDETKRQEKLAAKLKERKVPKPSQLEVMLAQSLSHGVIADERKKFVQDATFAQSDRYLPDTSRDRMETFKATKAGDKVAKKFNKALDKQVPVLRRKLYMEFFNEVRRFQRHQRRGRLDTRALHRVAFNSDRLFKQEMPKLDVNAEVMLLVDYSGSMVHRSQFVAAQCAGAMSQLCDLLKISNEVLAFTTGDRSSSADRRRFDRITPLRHFVVKPRHKRFAECKEVFYTLASWSNPCSHNVDGEALQWAATRLVNNLKPGKKPVLIVFSDGRPNACYGDRGPVLKRHLRNVIERVQRAGIALLGVGIETDYVSRFYDHWVEVKSLEDLGQDFFKEFRDVLRKCRTR